MTPDVFLNEFRTIANAPGGVQRLREMILQLAVQGKLVKQQNPDKENVEDLLKHIKNQKNLLIENKVIKNPKNETEVKDSEKYLDIPDSWKWVQLQTIGNVFNGNSINAKVKREKYSGKVKGFPFIATKDVKYGFQPINYENGVKIPIDETKFKIAHKNSVLICSEGGSAGKKCGITVKDICFGNKLFALELYGELYSKFFLSLYLSPSFYLQFQKRMTGIIGGISLNNFNTIPIPLPPRSEQQRIVAKVDQLMALCETLEKQQYKRRTIINNARISFLNDLADAQDSTAIKIAWKRIESNLPILFEKLEDVDDLKKSILQNAIMGKLVPQNPKDEPACELMKRIAAEKDELIKKKKIKKQKPLPVIRNDEKPFKVPEGWEWCHIGDVLTVKHGHAFKSAYFKEEIAPYVLTTPGNFYEKGGFRDRGRKTKYYDGSIPNDFLLKPNDIVVAMTEQAEGLLCSAAFIPNDGKKYLHNQRLGKLIPFSKEVSQDYVYWFFNSPYLRKEITASSTGMKVKHTSPDKIQKTLMPITSFEEQLSIVSVVNKLYFRCETLQKKLTECQNIMEQLAQSAVESLIGISMEKKETMKVPNTELITKLVLSKKPKATTHAPLSSLLSRNNDHLSAKSLWNISGLPIDEFYKQLKAEMSAGWIEEPEKAEVRIIEEKVK